jgi:hypothetical protein
MEELLVLAGSNAGSRIHLTRPAGKKQPMPKKDWQSGLESYVCYK